MSDIPTVHEALASVTKALEGIGKNRRNKEQGYNFRGIDDVLKALHPLLGEHGVTFVPDVVEREYEERVSAKGTVGHCCHLHVRYRIYGPAGDWVEGSAWGEGLDYGDKSTNKAMTAAFKYVLFQVFAVSDPDDDGDNQSPEDGQTTRATTTVRRPPPRQADPETGEIRRASPNKAASDKQIGLIKNLGKERGLDPKALQDVVESAIGRATSGWGDLSSADASKVIDFLQAVPVDQDDGAPDYAPGEEPF